MSPFRSAYVEPRGKMRGRAGTPRRWRRRTARHRESAPGPPVAGQALCYEQDNEPQWCPAGIREAQACVVCRKAVHSTAVPTSRAVCRGLRACGPGSGGPAQVSYTRGFGCAEASPLLLAVGVAAGLGDSVPGSLPTARPPLQSQVTRAGVWTLPQLPLKSGGLPAISQHRAHPRLRANSRGCRVLRALRTGVREETGAFARLTDLEHTSCRTNVVNF